MYQLANEPLPSSGTNMDSLLEQVKKNILPYCTNYSSPFAMAFPDAGNSIAALTGAILGDLINQNLINWVPCAPMATVIEMITLNWLRELVGFPFKKNPKNPTEIGGLTIAGGVSANTIAMLLAREKAFPNTMKRGVKEIDEPFVVIVPQSIDHYSARLSIGWLGLGENNVVRVPTKNFRYDLDKLKKIMSDLKSERKRIISLTAYAGDSRSMTCDKFIELRKLCDEYNTWFHVDGCHGTQLFFSEKLRKKLVGIEYADSITFDPHKVMNIPYVISVLLVKDTENLKLIQRPEDIITGEEHSFGQITPFFGSRPFNALKLYMLLKNMGVNGLSKVIEDRCSLANTLGKKIKESNDFVLINTDININSVIFMYCPKEIFSLAKQDDGVIHKINLINTKIQNEVFSNGEVWLHNFNIPDSSNVFGHGTSTILRPLRFMGGNPIIEEEHLDIMLKKVKAHGEKLLDELDFELVRKDQMNL